MSTSRYAVVRRLSRVLFLSSHGDMTIINRMRRQQGKDPTTTNDQQICTKENCLTCCKKFTAFMFSRVGLFFVMMGYVALGGVIFQALESGNEQDMRQIMHVELATTLDKLWQAILNVNSFPEKDKKGNFSLKASLELEKFEQIVIRQVQQGFDGRTADADHDWNYFGAVLYAVTLVSTIGYGHITTKTVQGKIATILYSAFGVPLMMLFVANIGSTMAKMFSFVFTRLTMILCCRMSQKKKRALALKNRQKLLEKTNQPHLIGDEKPSIFISNEKPKEMITPTKSNLKSQSGENSKELTLFKPILPSNSTSMTSSTPDVVAPVDVRQLSADVRLNMLTGMPTTTKSRSLASSTHSVEGKSKDALVRINELIRQNSVQDIEEVNDHVDDERYRRRSVDTNQIQYYINETKKLTSDLDISGQEKSTGKDDHIVTNLDENDMKQVAIAEETSDAENNTTKSKKNLKRSKSESTHNRKVNKKPVTDPPPTNDNESPTKTTTSSRRRFFARRTDKLKKHMTVDEGISENLLQQTQKSQSFNEHSSRLLPPPPNYEQSTTNDITPLPPTVTWKGEHQFYPTVDLTNSNLEDGENFDEDEEMAVPLLVTVFVIPLYLTLGAILFSIWEQWSFLNSFYFCFITITTIGFGDFVPGASLKVEAEKEKLISAAVYILFGLVLIAMCVNLMKEQLSQKVKRVASKLGSF